MFKNVIISAALLLFVTASFAQARVADATGFATLNSPPTSVAGGSLVTLTGTADPGTADFDITGPGGAIATTVTWHGNDYTVTFTAPNDPGQDIQVRINDQNGLVTATIRIT